MTRITIIGGHGKIALLLAPLLHADGHEVRGVIRNPDHAGEVEQAGAVPVEADVESMDTDALAELVRGSDVVVWSAGAGGGSAERTYAVDRDAAIRTIDAASQAGVERFVMVSYFGAGPDHGVPEDNGFYAYAEAKAAADAHLRGSDLRWTLVMPSSLTLDAPTGRIDVGGEASHVSRANVAAVLRAVIEAPTESVAGLEIPFNDGDTPVEEAVAGLR